MLCMCCLKFWERRGRVHGADDVTAGGETAYFIYIYSYICVVAAPGHRVVPTDTTLARATGIDMRLPQRGLAQLRGSAGRARVAVATWRGIML